MSSLRRSLVATAVAVLFVPALSGQAHAQCRGGQGGSPSSMQAQGRAMLRGQLNRQTSGLTAGQQFAGLRTILPQGLSLQTSGNLQLSGNIEAQDGTTYAGTIKTLGDVVAGNSDISLENHHHQAQGGLTGPALP